MLRKCFVVLLFIVLMSVQNVTLVKAESVYEESLELNVFLSDDMNCSTFLTFTVSSSNGPIGTSEFTSEPSFVYLYIECNPYVTNGVSWDTPTVPHNYSYSTHVEICLNGKMLDNPVLDTSKADALKKSLKTC